MYLRSISSCLDRRLCDEVGYAVVGSFCREETCISWPLSLLIAKTIVVDESDVVIRFTNKPEHCYPNPPYGVLDFGAMFDIDGYIQAGDREKKILILDYLVRALEKLFSWKRWDLDPLLVAKTKLVDRDFDYPLWSKKKIPSPDKKLTAQLMVRIDLRETVVYVAFRKYRATEIGLLLQVAIFPTTLNSPALLPDLERDIAWLSNTRIRIGRREVECPL
jgi:hypothetical protein